MTNPIKARVSECGMFATPINPYQSPYDCTALDKCECVKWAKFENNPQCYPLTSPQTPNSEIECVEVWQYQEMLSDWQTVSNARKEEFKSFEEYKARKETWNIETRQAFEPLTAPVDGVGEPTMNEQPKTVEEAANRFSDKYANSFTNEPDEINSIMFQSCKAGFIAAQSDPAFIADIVRQTLEYVANHPVKNVTTKSGDFLDKTKLIAMLPGIVNNIIKQIAKNANCK